MNSEQLRASWQQARAQMASAARPAGSTTSEEEAGLLISIWGSAGAALRYVEGRPSELRVRYGLRFPALEGVLALAARTDATRSAA